MGTTQHPKISIAAVTQIKEKEIGTVVLVVNTASLRKRCGLDDSNISYFIFHTSHTFTQYVNIGHEIKMSINDFPIDYSFVEDIINAGVLILTRE